MSKGVKLGLSLLGIAALAAGAANKAYAADIWNQTTLPWADIELTGPRSPDDESGAEKRKVAIFYFLWMCESGNTAEYGPTDVSEILKKHPEAAQQPLHPAWGDSHHGAYGASEGARKHYHYWGKPLFGYYCSSDEWVIDRHLRLLTDAGVDILIFDATNSVTYDSVVARVLKGLEKIRAQRGDAPQIVFYTNTASGKTMSKLYDMFYADDAPYRQPSAWFRMNEKPLMIGRVDEADKVVKEFFTLRQSQWPNEEKQDCGWPWMDFVRPQQVYSCNGKPEIINVSVAQHAETVKMSSLPFENVDANWGRGFHDGKKDHSLRAVTNGYNFQEQWDVAVEKDLPFVFVTGWNEWIAARFYTGESQFMVDLATPEFSRDIEMMEGDWTDGFYLQLIRNIRRYKGTKSPVGLKCGKAINIDGGFRQWRAVEPVFRDYTGDTAPRRHQGAGGQILEENSGRNDFDRMKVTCDEENVYFLATLADEITPRTDDKWMRLLIGVRNDGRGGDLDFAVNIDAPISDKLTSLHFKDWSGQWRRISENIRYRADGDKIHIAVPRRLLGVNSDTRSIRFKWMDNNKADDRDTELYVAGDAAPGGRMAFEAPLRVQN